MEVGASKIVCQQRLGPFLAIFNEKEILYKRP
jgi:hypothetical protein